MKNVGVWIRVSTDEQAKGDSPTHHLKRAEMYAELKGWKVKEVYDLKGVSGKSVFNHREAKRMLKHIHDGHITGLVFSNLSRLGRSTKELLEIGDHFQKYNADLISLAEEIDTSTPAGRLFFTIQGAIAQCEREQIASRVKASVQTRAKLGKSIGGRTPYGYDRKDGQLVINQDEASIRKLIYTLYLEHKRKKTVARILNERGHQTRAGKPWSHTTIQRLLIDPVAKGLRRTHYTERQATSLSSKLKPESEWIYLQVPAIITEKEWDTVQKLVTETAQEGHRPTKLAENLFTGYLFCACGRRMYKRKKIKKYHCTECRRKILASDLETIFHEQLHQYVVSPDEARRHLKESTNKQGDLNGEITSLQKEAKKLEAKIEALVDLHSSEQLPEGGFKRMYTPHATRLEAIYNTLPELEGRRDALATENLSADHIITEAIQLYKEFPKMDFKAKRAIVEATVAKIIIEDDTVSFTLHFLSPVHKEAQGNWGLQGHTTEL